MPANPHIRVGLLKKDEVEEAARIVRLAFGFWACPIHSNSWAIAIC
jgi:hypothetical protein